MLKSGIVLNENENLVVELEAELWAVSNHPLAKFWGAIAKLIALITGTKRQGFVVLTDQRVIEVSVEKVCWICDHYKKITYLMPNSVSEVGYSKEGTCCGCFCSTYTLFYEAKTQKTQIMLKDVDHENEAKRIVDAFYQTINK